MEENTSIYAKMVDSFGEYIQMVVAIEEIGEFTKELTKIIRNGFQRKEQFIIETADIIIVLRQVAYCYSIHIKDDHEEYGAYKINYLINQSLKKLSIIYNILARSLDYLNGIGSEGLIHEDREILESTIGNLLGHIKAFVTMFEIDEDINSQLKCKERELKEKFGI